jgi:hypothetical protein
MPVPWESVAIQDWYREAPSTEQARLKQLWIRDEAPNVYGQQVMADPVQRSNLIKWVVNYNMPRKYEDEDEIIRPETLSMSSGYKMIEDSPVFAEKSYKDQQNLKRIWYMKMSATDPEFQQLDYQQQQNYYMRLMQRAPSMAGLLKPMVDTEDERTKALRWEKSQEVSRRIGVNLADGFVQGFGSMILAPIKLMAGPDSAFTKSVNDLAKGRDWVNAVTEEHRRWWNTGLPRFVGFGAGIMLPVSPFKGLENFLAGTYKISTSGGKLLTRTPGLFAKTGAKLGVKGIPDLAYQVAGGAIAGGVQGLAEAVIDPNMDYKQALIREGTFGVAMEFAGRYFAMIRAVKKLAKMTDTDISHVYRTAFEFGSSAEGPERILREKLSTNPTAQILLQHGKEVDPNGIMLRLKNEPQGVDMLADLSGWKVHRADDFITLSKGSETYTFPGGEKAQTTQAIKFLDSREDKEWDVFFKNAVGKNMSEMINEAPTGAVEVRMGFQVNELQRKTILETLENHGITDPFPKGAGVRGKIPRLDELYQVISKPKTTYGAVNALSRRGFRFAEDVIENKSIVADLRHKLDEASPGKSFAILNKNTGKELAVQDYPVAFLEHPDINNPLYFEAVHSGNGQSTRDFLSNLVRQETNKKTAMTRVANMNNAVVDMYESPQLIEMRLKVPAGDEALEDITLHFSSIKQARDFMITGQNVNLEGMARKFFEGSESAQESYDQFVKGMFKRHRARAQKEFLPYQFLAQRAKQQRYFLGVYNGQYVLQDVLDDAAREVKYTSFDSLRKVNEFLEANDRRVLEPNFAGHLAEESLDDYIIGNFKDIMAEFSPKELRKMRGIGMRDAVTMELAPSQYVYKRFASMPEVMQYTKDTGADPMTLWHGIRESTQVHQSYVRRVLQELGDIKGKHIKKEESKALFRWLQSAVDDKELDEIKFVGRDLELRNDVYEDMVNTYGSQRATELAEKGAQLEMYYDHLFAETGMNWQMYIKYYHPHMAAELKKLNPGLGMRLDPARITQIPKADRKYFLELSS